MNSVLVTGGTGSFGQAFVRRLLEDGCERVVVFSRDELKQSVMRVELGDDPRLRWFIGDVRDRDRLRRAMAGVEVVVHAAAMKQVSACEENPLEAVKTNIGGAQNVIDAAIDANVRRVLALSTDKAVDACNLYGRTKAAAESLFVDANVYSKVEKVDVSGFADRKPQSDRDPSHYVLGSRRWPVFACTRYGNVLGSRGSVLPLFLAQHAAGEALTVTDPTATRFVLTLEQGVQFVLDCLAVMEGGEVFVPKLPTASVLTISLAVGGSSQLMGLRPGEKKHELLISQHEALRTLDRGWHYLVTPPSAVADRDWDGVPVSWSCVSSQYAERLTVEEFRVLAGLGAPSEAAAL